MSHTLLIPIEGNYGDIALNCSISFSFAVVGLSLTFTSLFILTMSRKLHYFEPRQWLKWRPSKVLTIPLLHLILVIVVLYYQGFKAETLLEFAETSADGRVRYEYYKEFCKIPLESKLILGLFLAIACFFVILLLALAFSAYGAKSLYKLRATSKAVNFVASCSYCQIIIVIGAVLVAVIGRTFESIMIITPIVSFLIAILSIAFIELPRVIKHDRIFHVSGRSRGTLWKGSAPPGRYSKSKPTPKKR